MWHVASVSLDLTDSHLDEPDVAASPPVAVLAPLFRDPQHVHGIPQSSARKHGLHPSQVERIRIANLLAERTAETRSIVRLWGPGFLVLQPRACLGFQFLFDMAPYVELARAGARRTDFTLPSLGAHRPTLGQGLYWKGDLWAMEAQFDDPSRVQSAPIQSHRWSATAAGTPLWSEWSSCSFRTLLVTPAPLTPTLQQLRENCL